MCYRWVESTYTFRWPRLGPIATVAAVIVILFGYWLNSESLPASFVYVASLLILHFVTTL